PVPSKKQSVAKPPDETVFFIDRPLGIEPIRTELVNAGLVVEIHDDHFARDEEDRVWLRTVGERGWLSLPKIRGCDTVLWRSPRCEPAGPGCSSLRQGIFAALRSRLSSWLRCRGSAECCIPCRDRSSRAFQIRAHHGHLTGGVNAAP